MHKQIKLLFPIVALTSLLIAGCGSAGSNTVSRVTPIPEDTASPMPATATPSPIPATEEPETASSADETDGIAQVADANATATPLNNELAPGEARQIAMATDIPMQPEIENPLTFDAFPVSLTFDDFYAGFDLRRGLLMTDKIMSLDGQQVVIEGYVAPPLKPRIDFFVLTRIQLAFCPFCSADTEWPTDIALVYMPSQDVMDTQYPVRVTGQLELGTSTDAETGMVSVIRIYAEDIEQIRG